MIKSDENKLNVFLHKCQAKAHSEDLLANEMSNEEIRSKRNMEEIMQQIK